FSLRPLTTLLSPVDGMGIIWPSPQQPFAPSAHTMTTDSHAKARRLLDAQISFWLQELSPQRLHTIVREEAAYLYEQLDNITLMESVSTDKIKATAHRYALEMEIGGAIPEMFGEIANIIYELPAQETTRIGDLC